MNKQQRLVFAGPVGSGKTTAIKTLSDEPIISTEVAITQDKAQPHKTHTTVALDYGVIHLSEEHSLQLYGTPGQPHFNFMWEIASRNSIGLILLLDAQRPALLQDLTFFIHAFSALITSHGFAIGLTQTDTVQNADLLHQQINHELERLQLAAPVLSVDPHERKELVQLIKALLYTLDPSLIRVS